MVLVKELLYQTQLHRNDNSYKYKYRNGHGWHYQGIQLPKFIHR
jgi:hypothetical protein